jgi:hypothetical protein
MEIVTGHRGTPHVTPYKVRDFNIGIVGAEDYVMNGGSELEAQLVSNNRIDIKDGSICMQGTHAVIPKNINDELTIENGMQGEKRIDLIVARYEKVSDSGVESVNTVVLQGTPSKESPIVPGHVVGDIRNGDLKHEMPLYEVELDGINVVEVRPVFKKIVSAAEQQKMIELLNGKSIIESGKNDNGYYRKYADGTLEMWGTSNAIGSQGVVIVTLPQPFIDTVFRMCANQIYHSNTPVSVTSTQVQSKQSFLIYAREPNGTLPASGCKYNWFVTGTWK